jgi:hypothetical protein
MKKLLLFSAIILGLSNITFAKPVKGELDGVYLQYYRFQKTDSFKLDHAYPKSVFNNNVITDKYMNNRNIVDTTYSGKILQQPTFEQIGDDKVNVTYYTRKGDKLVKTFNIARNKRGRVTGLYIKDDKQLMTENGKVLQMEMYYVRTSKRTKLNVGIFLTWTLVTFLLFQSQK